MRGLTAVLSSSAAGKSWTKVKRGALRTTAVTVGLTRYLASTSRVIVVRK